MAAVANPVFKSLADVLPLLGKRWPALFIDPTLNIIKPELSITTTAAALHISEIAELLRLVKEVKNNGPDTILGVPHVVKFIWKLGSFGLLSLPANSALL